MSPQSLHHVLSAYPAECRPRTTSPPGETGGFSGAVIVRLETDLGPLCLRGWPKQSLPSERILGLHRLLRFAFDAGLKEIAVPIRALNGETLVHCHSQDWQLEPWLPGRWIIFSAGLLLLFRSNAKWTVAAVVLAAGLYGYLFL
jgi:hypothetical protein